MNALSQKRDAHVTICVCVFVAAVESFSYEYPVSVADSDQPTLVEIDQFGEPVCVLLRKFVEMTFCLAEGAI